MRRPLQNALLAGAALGLALLVCEAGLGAIGVTRRLETPSNPTWRWIVYDPLVLRKNQPGFVLERGNLEVHINAQGFRGPEIAVPKPPGTVRIACLGDSTTFGVWRAKLLEVWAKASYPGELATLLRAEGYAGVDVVNAGVPGNTTGEGLAQLLVHVLPLEPDVITLRFGNNDHLRTLSPERTPVANPIEYEVLRRVPPWILEGELPRLAFHAYRRLAARRGSDGPHRVSLAQFETNLRRFVAIARARGIHLLFLDFPYRPLAQGESPGEVFPNLNTEAESLAELHAIHGAYQAVVARVAAESGTPLVRTAEALAASPEPAFTLFDLSHPNEAGARIIAQRVLGELSQRGWLGTARD